MMAQSLEQELQQLESMAALDDELAQLEQQFGQADAPQERPDTKLQAVLRRASKIPNMGPFTPIGDAAKALLALDKSEVTQELARVTGKPFNTALVDAFGNPGDVRSALAPLGITEAIGEEAEGVLPRASRIAGATAPLAGGIAGTGRFLTGTAIKGAEKYILPNLERLGILKTLWRGAAEAPLKGEALASLTAGAGGEVAAELGAGEGGQLVGETIGGAASVLSPGALISRAAADQVRKRGPGFLALLNDETRASRLFQEAAADPYAASAKIDPNSPVSPARQTEDPRLIAIEEAALREAPPDEAARIRAQRETTQRETVDEGTALGGDVEAPRAIIAAQGKATVDRATSRADKAIKEAEQALADIDPGDDVRDISGQARDKVRGALAVARQEERALWNQVDQELPRSLDNTAKEVDDILKETGKFNRAEAIPAKIRAALDDEGELVFRDLHGLRQDIQAAKARALAEPGSANEVRILSRLERALLDDMSAGDLPELQTARDFSRQLNEKFTHGKIGEVLGTTTRRVERVPAADTLSAVVGSQFPERDIGQLLKATPEAKADVERFIRGNFLVAAVKNGVVNQVQANRFISNLRKKGVFNVLPDLEADLTNAASKSQSAQVLKERAEMVKQRGGARLEHQSKESLTSVFLGQPVGEETAVLLDPKNANRAQQLAASFRSRMGGNEAAEEGLRTGFSKQLMKKAAGKNDFPSGEELAKLINQNEATLRALGFDDGMIQRLRQTATTLRQVQAAPSQDALQKLIDDPKSFFYTNLVAIVSARTASLIGRKTGGKGAGVGIQTAGRGATAGTKFTKLILKDGAIDLITKAIEDGKVMKDMLVRNNATAAQQERLKTRLNAWIAGAAIDQEPEEE